MADQNVESMNRARTNGMRFPLWEVISVVPPVAPPAQWASSVCFPLVRFTFNHAFRSGTGVPSLHPWLP